MSSTGFRVSVVCDSIASGVRLTTFACRFPRVILAEVNTHRAISKNAASSRAIPVSHFIEQVESDPFIPGDLPDGEWMGNSPGMVAMEKLTEDEKAGARYCFLGAKNAAVTTVNSLARLRISKQDANRLLEPFQWVRWVGTATNWDNFFALRTDHRAYPPFRFLARCMWVAYTRSVPQDARLHLPFVTPDDWMAARAVSDTVEPPDWFPDWRYGWTTTKKAAFNLMAWSAARCARVSVKNFRTDDTDRKKDYETFLKLTTDYPRHSSPLEHQAFVSPDYPDFKNLNFRHPWVQFRKLLPGETVNQFSPTAAEVDGWNIPDDVFGGTPGVDW